MSDFRYAIDVAQVPPRRATSFQIDARWFTVCQDNGTWYAFDHHCPHAGGPLGEGEVCDGCIVCPVHGWPFDLKTGLTDPNMPWMRLKFYRCEVREGQVYIDVSAPIPPLPQ